MSLPVHILLVDDDHRANQENSKIIREHGFRASVKTALNGGHALLCLEQIYNHRPHDTLIILLDTQMPIMNGFEFMAAFNKTDYRNKNNIRIIMMISDQNAQNEIEKARRSGVRDFIQKPIAPAELAKLLSSNSRAKKVA